MPAAALVCALILSPSLREPGSERTLVPARAAALRAPLDDAGYWRFADRLVAELASTWDARAGVYRSSRAEPLLNANLLLVHSVAAQSGHRGPARNDARARRIAARLVAAFVERPPAAHAAAEQAHAPGWTSSLAGDGLQHLVYDADLVDGLVAAFRARRALGLRPEVARAIADRIHRTVSGRFWRWPSIRLNQISWYALMYAADAEVTGDPARLRGDLRRQIVRFARRARVNFGPGLSFRYLPHRPAGHFMNVDSAEYANIVLSFARFLPAARRAGMRPLPAAATRLLRQWVRRTIAGYWTHGGYLNWDTGLGFNRWHQTKKLALSQQALIAIAGDRRGGASAWRSWAKWIFDRGLVLYDRWRRAHGGIPPGLSFGVNAVPQTAGDARLAAARMAANAARALEAGLGRAAAGRPPALYSFDPGTGRLAVTTPAYNTAIVPVSRGAFPYGGIDLARLYDGDQRVAAGIGGRPPASFGVHVRDAAGRTLLVTQRPQPGPPPIELLRAPAGVGVAASTRARRAYAGPFSDLRVRGRVAGAAAQVTSTYRFLPRSIEARWDVGAGVPAVADVLFPSWGRRARVTVDGTTRLGRARVPVGRGTTFEVGGRYRVVVLDAPAGASARLVHTRRQLSAPRPGPTLAIELPGNAALRVRIVPER